jgi:hypothetical protein
MIGFARGFTADAVAFVLAMVHVHSIAARAESFKGRFLDLIPSD